MNAIQTAIMVRHVALAFLGSLYAWSAGAIELNGRTVALPAPAGYCAFDESTEPDATWFRNQAMLMAPQNRLLSDAVPCDELNQWRRNSDRTFSRFVMIFTAETAIARRVVITRAAWLAQMGRTLDAAVANTNRTVDGANESFQREGLALRSMGITNLGVLRRTDEAHFFGQINRFEAAGSPATQLVVGAVTVLNGVPITVGMGEAVVGNDLRVPTLLDATMRYVHQLVSSNPEIPPIPRR
jgi:hypothetical protein